MAAMLGGEGGEGFRKLWVTFLKVIMSRVEWGLGSVSKGG